MNDVCPRKHPLDKHLFWYIHGNKPHSKKPIIYFFILCQLGNNYYTTLQFIIFSTKQKKRGPNWTLDLQCSPNHLQSLQISSLFGFSEEGDHLHGPILTDFWKNHPISYKLGFWQKSISGKLIQANYWIWMSFPEISLAHDGKIEISKKLDLLSRNRSESSPWYLEFRKITRRKWRE